MVWRYCIGIIALSLSLVCCSEQLNADKFQEEIDDEINYQLAVVNLLDDFNDLFDLYSQYLPDYRLDELEEEFFEDLKYVMEAVEDREDPYDQSGNYQGILSYLFQLYYGGDGMDDYTGPSFDFTEEQYQIISRLIDSYPEGSPLLSDYKTERDGRGKKIYRTTELTTGIHFLIELEKRDNTVYYSVTYDIKSWENYFN